MSHRVRAIYQGNTEWPVGTFLLSSPKAVHTAFGARYEVGLLTKMNVIQEDAVEDRFSLPAGTPVIPTVVSLIHSTGETRIAVTDSSSVLTSALTWDAGNSKLAIINELLQSAGYWALWCDGGGQFRVEPYVDPASRPVSHVFEYGEASLYLPDWEHEQNHSSVPNRFVAIGEGDEENPPLVGVAVNEDPASPYSFQARGRWITAEPDEGVEAETQTVIDQYAARRLRDLMDPVSRLTVSHAMLQLEQNALVSFIPEDGVQRLATVQRMACDFVFAPDISAEWRQVL
ncbi:hypothetical protein [Microbacterium sp. NIBRBAC000506063]|uniref:hypothetical protein n=1 Tax=Microbacterium sp. NIBRBAC000506063 TaxID=2734618 RepID=UPI001CB6B907|nr:hypothetical protein [Microbacterium sp. NIBRBAC000506063]